LTTKQKAMTFDVGVYALAVDTSGRYLAGAGINDTVYLWDLNTEEIVFELAGHQETINTVAFSPDGSYLATGGDDMTVRVWDVLSGRLLVAREFDSPIQALAFSPDGRSLFTGNGNTTCYQIEFAKLLED
jgi:WD40 repeat protein